MSPMTKLDSGVLIGSDHGWKGTDGGTVAVGVFKVPNRYYLLTYLPPYPGNLHIGTYEVHMSRVAINSKSAD